MTFRSYLALVVLLGLFWTLGFPLRSDEEKLKQARHFKASGGEGNRVPIVIPAVGLPLGKNVPIVKDSAAVADGVRFTLGQPGVFTRMDFSIPQPSTDRTQVFNFWVGFFH